jgi:hypothetical protein
LNNIAWIPAGRQQRMHLRTTNETLCLTNMLAQPFEDVAPHGASLTLSQLGLKLWNRTGCRHRPALREFWAISGHADSLLAPSFPTLLNTPAAARIVKDQILPRLKS